MNEGLGMNMNRWMAQTDDRDLTVGGDGKNEGAIDGKPSDQTD